MPPKRSQKYLPMRSRRSRRHQGSKPQKNNEPDAYLYVDWVVPQSVVLSSKQWEILTNSLCYPGAISESFPGHAELALPILKLKFDNPDTFREFREKAILVRRHTAYNITHVCSSAGSARCIIASS